MLEFNIRNQTIDRIDRFSPATDSVDYLTAKFNFLTEDWTGKTKKALFRSGTVSYEAAINASGVCTVPWEILVAPDNKFSVLSGGCIKIFVSVVGTADTVTMPTKETRVELSVSGLTESLNGSAPTPDIYQQFVDTVKADNDATVLEIKEDNAKTVEAVAKIETSVKDVADQVMAADEYIKNNYANALKGEASGEVVRVDDVSPIEHTAKVKVHGKNLIDVSRFTVQDVSKSCAITKVGDDYIVISTTDDYNGNGHCASSNTLRELCPQMESGKTYVLSATSSAFMQSAYFSSADVYWDFNKSLVVTDELLDCRFDLYGLASIREQGTGDCVISNIQIEEGDTATEYTPYIDPTTVTVTRYGVDESDNPLTYTPNSDGTVDGVTSIYPTMTVLTDTEGATVYLDYNRDTNAEIKRMVDLVGDVETLLGGI